MNIHGKIIVSHWAEITTHRTEFSEDFAHQRLFFVFFFQHNWKKKLLKKKMWITRFSNNDWADFLKNRIKSNRIESKGCFLILLSWSQSRANVTHTQTLHVELNWKCKSLASVRWAGVAECCRAAPTMLPVLPSISMEMTTLGRWPRDVSKDACLILNTI